MQFRYPEILYALAALLIPVVVHLFQLQRFIKLPFTNVELLKKVEVQSRKSSRLKRWLVLMNRLLLFAALILAFARPYKKAAASQNIRNINLFIDNSMSMSAKGEQGSLFNQIQKNLLNALPAKAGYRILTADEDYRHLNAGEAKEIIKSLRLSPQSPHPDRVEMRMKSLHGDSGNINVYISDYQLPEKSEYVPDSSLTHIVVSGTKKTNISIDTVLIGETNRDFIQLGVRIHSSGNVRLSDVELYAEDQSGVISKNTLNIPPDTTMVSTLQVPVGHRVFSVQLNVDDRFDYDNVYRISISEKEKIKVLVIGENNDFLSKIFNRQEFQYNESKSSDVQIKNLPEKDVVVLNALKKIPSALAEMLANWLHTSRTLILIPPAEMDLPSWNALLQNIGAGQVAAPVKDSMRITNIRYMHPVFKGVFERTPANFQYPETYMHYRMELLNALPVLEYQDRNAFVSEINRGDSEVFLFSAPLDPQSSDFTRSPLIVPLFYNMARINIRRDNLSFRTGNPVKIPVDIALDKDEVLHLTDGKKDWIPVQDIRAERVVVQAGGLDLSPGFYHLTYRDSLLMSIAVNPPRDESSMRFYTEKDFETARVTYSGEIGDYFQTLENKMNTSEYYSVFLWLALLFILLEMLILRFL